MMTEHQIQASISTYLDIVLPPSIRMVSIPNNPRSRVSGAMEKARGSKKGFPDFMLINGVQQGAIAAFEVKTAKGRLSPEQREWQQWCNDNRIPHFVVRSIDDVREALVQLGIPTREAGAS